MTGVRIIRDYGNIMGIIGVMYYCACGIIARLEPLHANELARLCSRLAPRLRAWLSLREIGQRHWDLLGHDAQEDITLAIAYSKSAVAIALLPSVRKLAVLGSVAGFATVEAGLLVLRQ